jgi:magnesium transporter
VFVGLDFVISMRHSESPDLTGVRERMESEPDLLALGPEAILYSIMDRVVDGYGPVVAGLENDIDEIETEIFSGDAAVSRRIYELSREVIEFRRATHPLNTMLQGLQDGFDKYEVHEEMRRYLRDVADHNLQASDRVDGFSQILRDMLTVNATLVAQKQNEEMRALTEASHAQGIEVKKISAWAAILFAPTLIGTAYGMNFASMPGLDSPHGFTMAMALMVATCLGLYVVFKRRDWL